MRTLKNDLSLFCWAIVSFDVSSFPFLFFFYPLLKCETFFETLFELNYTGITLLYQLPEAGEIISRLKEHLLSFSIPEHVVKLISLKKIELNDS